MKERKTKKTITPTIDEATGLIDITVEDYKPFIQLENNDESTEKVLFKPTPGPQTWFLEADEDEVLYAGTRGGGKSAALIVDPLRFVNKKSFRALIIRRHFTDLADLIQKAIKLYRQVYPTVRWNDQKKIFTFPTGATIEFGYLDTFNDVERYRGQEYTWMGFDEISQIPEFSWYQRVKGSLRTAEKGQKTYVRATSNPTGVGREWVREYWVDAAPSMIPKIEEVVTPVGTIKLSRKWINSSWQDNPHLYENNPEYIAFLQNLPPALKKQWFEGNWDAVEGAAFPDFNNDTHVIPAFKIPREWTRIRGADYGYSSPAACVWAAISPDNEIYIYKELVQAGLVAREFGKKVREMEEDERVRYGVLDSSCWAKRGESGPSLAEEMINAGCRWRPSDRSPGSRKAGKVKLHELLRKDSISGKPKLFVFDTCKHVIKMFNGIPLDENDAEDVDTDSPLDHQYDALRYLVMSRPSFSYDMDTILTNLTYLPDVVDTTFGY